MTPLADEQRSAARCPNSRVRHGGHESSPTRHSRDRPPLEILGVIEATEAATGAILLDLSMSEDVEPHIRQMAAVILKRYVKHHWHQQADGFR